jgi:hypothetical protein
VRSLRQHLVAECYGEVHDGGAGWRPLWDEAGEALALFSSSSFPAARRAMGLHRSRGRRRGAPSGGGKGLVFGLFGILMGNSHSDLARYRPTTL